MELNRSRNRSCFEYGIRELGHANSRNIFCVASDIFLAWVCRSSAMCIPQEHLHLVSNFHNNCHTGCKAIRLMHPASVKWIPNPSWDAHNRKGYPWKNTQSNYYSVQTSKLQMRFKHAIVILRAASPKQAFIFRSLTRPLAIMKPPKKLLYVKWLPGKCKASISTCLFQSRCKAAFLCWVVGLRSSGPRQWR